jgi:hypothetical protein
LLQQNFSIIILPAIERERNEIAEMTSEVEKLHEVALDKKHFADQLQARVAYLQAEVEKRKKGTRPIVAYAPSVYCHLDRNCIDCCHSW